MRVLLLITHMDDRGGAQSHVAALARGLAAAGDDVTVVHGGTGAARCVEPGPRLQVLALPELQRALGLGADLRATRALRRLLAQTRPELLHMHSSKAGAIGSWLALLTPAARIPTVFTAHGWNALTAAPGGSLGRAAVALGFRLAMAPASRLVTLSAHDHDVAVRANIAQPPRLRQLPLGIADYTPLARQVAQASNANEPTRLVAVARHCWHKDAATLLDALAQLRELPWTLDWLGGGPELPASQARVTALGLADRVHLHGDVEDVAARLANAQAFVLATRAEGLPIAVLEAMRAGLPVIASDVGAIGEAIGEAGWLVHAGEATALGTALGEAIVGPKARGDRGALGRWRFVQAYGEAAMITAHRALYAEVRADLEP